MIARIWNGETAVAHFDAYSAFLKQVAIPDYEKTIGFKGLAFLRNKDDQCARFKLITYWENIEAIKNFAGPEYERAKYYPEDRDFLLHFEEYVEHFEVFS